MFRVSFDFVGNMATIETDYAKPNTGQDQEAFAMYLASQAFQLFNGGFFQTFYDALCGTCNEMGDYSVPDKFISYYEMLLKNTENPIVEPEDENGVVDPEFAIKGEPLVINDNRPMDDDLDEEDIDDYEE